VVADFLVVGAAPAVVVFVAVFFAAAEVEDGAVAACFAGVFFFATAATALAPAALGFDDPADVNSYMAAVQAVFDTELEGVPTLRLLSYAPPVGKGVWNEWLGRQHVHGLRTKVLNLIRQFRGKHRLETITEGDSPESGSTSTGGITDEVFLQRWTKAAKIFAHHDRNYAQKRSGGAPWWGGPRFVFDGATTMFDLGKRAWLGLDVGAEFGAEMRKREEEDF
jgi:hypothetical protein